ncbi:MAG: glycosyltransferase family 2 protein [Chloroflexi bacterium]|nr:glycosyltransferase family 2 protein [Chloroflexota bacterium]
MKDLAVIIVSYNVRQLLEDCLASVLASHGVSFDVCVVDNASHDGSGQMVRERFPQAVLLESPWNGGYSYANNLGMERLGVWPPRPGQDPMAPGHRYVLLLNPDTRVGPQDMARAVAYLDDHLDMGILGPKLVRQDGSLDLACRRSFPTPAVALYRVLGLSKLFPRSRRFARYNMTYLDPDETAEVDAVAGAFMLVRREAILQAGLLDESFFLYGEDLDWALRIKAQGWKAVYYPAVTVLHHKGGSSRNHRRRKTIEFYRAMLIFYQKHYAPQTFFLLRWLIVAAILGRGALAYVQDLLLAGAVDWARSLRTARTQS